MKALVFLSPLLAVTSGKFNQSVLNKRSLLGLLHHQHGGHLLAVRQQQAGRQGRDGHGLLINEAPASYLPGDQDYDEDILAGYSPDQNSLPGYVAEPPNGEYKLVPEYQLSPEYETVPEYQLVPEYQPSVPEYESVPEYQPEVPEYKPEVVEYQPVVPEYHPEVQEYQPAVPEYQPEVPEYVAVPEYQNQEHQVKTSVPDLLEYAPEYQAAPQYQAGPPVPEYEVQKIAPEYQAGPPEYQPGAPEYQSGAPEYQAGAPEYVAGSPEYQVGPLVVGSEGEYNAGEAESAYAVAIGPEPGYAPALKAEADYAPPEAGYSEPLIAGYSEPVIAGYSDPVLAGYSEPLISGYSEPVIAGYSEPVIAESDNSEPQEEYGVAVAPSGDYTDPIAAYAATEPELVANYGETGEETEEGYSEPSKEEYGAPVEEAYATPEAEYGAPSAGFPFSSVAALSCPGGSIEACVEVCPGSSARVYGACVGGCASRCPE